MTTQKKFRLDELNSRDYQLWELKKEEEKKPARRADGRKLNGGDTERMSLLRSLSKTQRMTLRDNAEIMKKLDLIIEKLDITPKENIKQKFEELMQ